MGKNAKKITSVERKREMKIAKNIVPKVHEKAADFFADKARNRWIFGGNRTGKTTAGATAAVSSAVESACEGWVVSLSTQVQRDVAQRKILEELEKYKNEITFDCVMHVGSRGVPLRGIIDFIVITRSDGTESRIGFKNCEQGREKFQGTSLDWVWFDEEPLEDIYDECLLRTLDCGGRIWGTLTPLKGRTWIYERIYQKGILFGKRKCPAGTPSLHFWSWADNPFLLSDEIAIMEKQFSKDVLECRKFGQFAGLDSTVFKEINIVDLNFGTFTLKNQNGIYNASMQAEKFVTTGISINPRGMDDWVLLWFGVDAQNRIFVKNENVDCGRSIESVAETIKRGVQFDGAIFLRTESTARLLGDGRAVVKEFARNKVAVKLGNADEEVDAVFQIKRLFAEKRLFVAETCVNLVGELQEMTWKRGRVHAFVDALATFVSNMKMPKSLCGKSNFENYKRRIINEKK
jgi:phage terminase large subunit-like protein